MLCYFCSTTEKTIFMKSSNFVLIVLVCDIMLLMNSCTASNEKPALMPSPVSVQFGKGAFTFSHETVISVEDRQQMEVAEWFAWLFAHPAGFVPKVFQDASDADIILRRDDAMMPESYRINAGRTGIVIEASGQAGFFYAFQTLRQSLPEEISASRHADGLVWAIPAMTIYDGPRYSHRCLKVDVEEHFIPAEELKAFVECMSMLKLNYLHLFGYELYSDEELEDIMSHASGLYVDVVCGEGCKAPLYSCPDDIASHVLESVAALAEVAWSDREVVDRIGFNRAVDALDVYLSQTILGYSNSVYDIGLSALH